MFTKQYIGGYTSIAPGISQKTLAYGEKTHLIEFFLEKGSKLPRHAHPHEQTGYMVRGGMLMTIGDETFKIEPGDSWSIPGGLEHHADVLEDSIVVEVFAPLREDLLPK